MQKLCIVTPSYNAASIIEDTIRSIAENEALQDGSLAVHYVLSDGASPDGTADIAVTLRQEINRPNLKFDIISEPDDGMYDAIARGFRQCTDADFYCYMGAGDYYSSHAFGIVAAALKDNVQWITGQKVVYDAAGAIQIAYLPTRYKKHLITRGMYGTVLRFLQTESTFWSADLHAHLNLDQLATYKLAGDYYIWKTFAARAQLYLVDAWLGGFRTHEGQLSADMAPYLAELRTIRDEPRPRDYLEAYYERLFDIVPSAVKRRLHRKYIVEYNPPQ